LIQNVVSSELSTYCMIFYSRRNL